MNITVSRMKLKLVNNVSGLYISKASELIYLKKKKRKKDNYVHSYVFLNDANEI